MSEADPEVIDGLEEARRVEREQRDEDIDDSLESTARIADAVVVRSALCSSGPTCAS